MAKQLKVGESTLYMLICSENWPRYCSEFWPKCRVKKLL